MSAPQQQIKTTGPFCLIDDAIGEIEKDWVRTEQIAKPELQEIDIRLLNEQIKVLPGRDGSLYPQDKFEQLLARSRMIRQAQTSPNNNCATAVNVAKNFSHLNYISPNRFDNTAESATLK